MRVFQGQAGVGGGGDDGPQRARLRGRGAHLLCAVPPARAGRNIHTCIHTYIITTNGGRVGGWEIGRGREEGDCDLGAVARAYFVQYRLHAQVGCEKDNVTHAQLLEVCVCVYCVCVCVRACVCVCVCVCSCWRRLGTLRRTGSR